MSADQRGPTPIRPIDERTGHSRSNSAAGSNHRNSDPLQRPSADSDRQEPPLSYRIERTKLRARIAALEQLVETSERRRQAVIDQYERLLTDRADDGETSVHESESQSRSLVARFIGR
ncbi:hypothetical protein HYG81_11455 [Natrinema zhouii]|uniref:Uncharacterized protein n=1 Tax=Natrinema zhouii TaxID=1710539 RepID=A0A7D6CMV3_9EURY|nr:hypothetical protein [Natrinema zhouii]QLK24734.1 hypothetical protein HYG81_11455 [Natrinema zhouii]